MQVYVSKYVITYLCVLETYIVCSRMYSERERFVQRTYEGMIVRVGLGSENVFNYECMGLCEREIDQYIVRMYLGLCSKNVFN